MFTVGFGNWKQIIILTFLWCVIVAAVVDIVGVAAAAAAADAAVVFSTLQLL